MIIPVGNSRTLAVARKEMLHILHNPTTLFFTLFIPVMEMFMLGYAIDTNIKMFGRSSGTKRGPRKAPGCSRSSKAPDPSVSSASSILRKNSIVRSSRGDAQAVGIKIPEDYSRRIQAGDQAEIPWSPSMGRNRA